MKRFLCKLSLAALIGLFINSAVSADERVVRIYNWLEYLPSTVLKNFESETGIKVIYDSFDSVDVLESKLLTGQSGYDVVFPSSSSVGKLITAKAVVPLDKSKLPNLVHMDPLILKNLEVAGDTGNQYAVPYMWGTTLIGLNVEKVRQVLGQDVPLDSWDLIFKEENISKLSKCGVAFLDAADEVMPIALKYLGLDPNSSAPEDYQKAKELMLKIRPYVRYFNSGRYSTDMANGDLCIAVGWSGAFKSAIDGAKQAGKNLDIKIIIPQLGVPTWADVMTVPVNSPHPQEGLAFINYMMRPEVIALASNAIGYPNANKDATPLVDEAVRNNPVMYVPQDQLKSLYPLVPHDAKLERLRTRLWNTIRTGK